MSKLFQQMPQVAKDEDDIDSIESPIEDKKTPEIQPQTNPNPSQIPYSQMRSDIQRKIEIGADEVQVIKLNEDDRAVIDKELKEDVQLQQTLEIKKPSNYWQVKFDDLDEEEQQHNHDKQQQQPNNEDFSGLNVAPLNPDILEQYMDAQLMDDFVDEQPPPQQIVDLKEKLIIQQEKVKQKQQTSLINIPSVKKKIDRPKENVRNHALINSNAKSKRYNPKQSVIFNRVTGKIQIQNSANDQVDGQKLTNEDENFIEDLVQEEEKIILNQEKLNKIIFTQLQRPAKVPGRQKRPTEEEEIEDVMEPRVNEDLQLVQIIGKIHDKVSDLIKYHVVVKFKRRKDEKWMDEKNIKQLKQSNKQSLLIFEKQLQQQQFKDLQEGDKAFNIMHRIVSGVLLPPKWYSHKNDPNQTQERLMIEVTEDNYFLNLILGKRRNRVQRQIEPQPREQKKKPKKIIAQQEEDLLDYDYLTQNLNPLLKKIINKEVPYHEGDDKQVIQRHIIEKGLKPQNLIESSDSDVKKSKRRKKRDEDREYTDQPRKPRGRGSGKKDMRDSDLDDYEKKPKGRGRGRGKGGFQNSNNTNGPTSGDADNDTDREKKPPIRGPGRKKKTDQSDAETKKKPKRSRTKNKEEKKLKEEAVEDSFHEKTYEPIKINKKNKKQTQKWNEQDEQEINIKKEQIVEQPSNIEADKENTPGGTITVKEEREQDYQSIKKENVQKVEEGEAYFEPKRNRRNPDFLDLLDCYSSLRNLKRDWLNKVTSFEIVGHKYYKDAIMLTMKDLNGKNSLKSAEQIKDTHAEQLSNYFKDVLIQKYQV